MTPPARVPRWDQRLWLHPAAPPLVVVLCLLPALWLVRGIAADALGANPAETLIRALGDWTLRFLCLTLAVTPLRVTFNWLGLARLRRTLGLATFGYLCLHVLCYLWFDMGWDTSAIVKDIAKRPFILVGTLAALAMLPLALTSTHAAVRRLGGARWRALHRLVYLIAPLALLHFFWMRSGKQLYGDVAIYGAVLGLLLGWRLWRHVRGRLQARSRAGATS